MAEEMRMLRATALRLLARSEQSEYNLKQKLLRAYKRQNPHAHLEFDALIATLLDDLKAKDWLSDKRFSEAICRQKINAGKGKCYIETYLKNHAIDPSIIESVLATLSHDSLVTQALTVRQKRFGNPLTYSRENHYAILKQKRFLLQRGFSPDEINDVFKLIA